MDGEDFLRAFDEWCRGARWPRNPVISESQYGDRFAALGEH
jgi:hypothetical protein